MVVQKCTKIRGGVQLVFCKFGSQLKFLKVRNVKAVSGVGAR
jgi:hypothetical protein